ncbi:MAG: hypothetical protein WBC91_12030 [Phototrophicaceae bacterium]
MAYIRTKTTTPLTFDRLMRLGQVAHAQGDDKTAHNYWQQAAMLEPNNEQVWTALMWVIDNDADRRVCLTNILTINPANVQAQGMLDDLIGETQPQEERRIIADVTPTKTPKLNIIRVLALGSIFGIGVAIIAILLQLLIA